MGSAFRIVVECEHPLGPHAIDEAFARIEVIEQALSDYRLRSDVSQLAQAPVGQPIPIQGDLRLALIESQRFHRLTGGAFDCTLGPLTQLWRDSFASGSRPDPAALHQAMDSVGMHLLRLDEHGSTLTLLRPDMRLDFGGIGKGYAADQAAQVLRDHAITRFLIDAGGDVLAGEAPEGQEGWRVRVGAAERGWSRVICLQERAAATSGDLYRFVEIDGVRSSHILDPRTGEPINTPRIATVLAHTGAAADALATALSVLGPDPGLPVLERLPGVDAAVIERALSPQGEHTTGKQTPGDAAVWLSPAFPPEVQP